MTEILTQLEFWHWLSVAVLLLIAEVLGAGGFLLGIAIGALVLGVLVAIFPTMSWQIQLVLFSVLSVSCTLIYWKRFRRLNNETDHPELNDRRARLVGSKAVLIDAIINGKGKVQIEDALWTVLSDEDLPAATVVEITGVRDMALVVKQASARHD